MNDRLDEREIALLLLEVRMDEIRAINAAIRMLSTPSRRWPCRLAIYALEDRRLELQTRIATDCAPWFEVAQ